VQQLGTSCCQVQPGEHLATLTLADVERIEAATGSFRGAFVETEVLEGDAQVEAWLEAQPMHRGYFGPARERLTLRRRKGACTFLGPAGCRLSASERPTQCLLYPFTWTASGAWGLAVERFGSVPEARASGGHACLAVEESDSFEALRAAFSLDAAQVEALAERLRAEVLEHGRRQRRSDRGPGMR
jgi:Fe-S-cluster containining protein